ncbi:flagellar hook protein FliD [Saccharophagus sp. K07]|uniref:flagellar filament capping protein FliD n=1 Tax=Saccharophagus sp. K07 TaxID=2283636 RepID=UPI001651FAC6|nr:flagellar filament capping protein FliD [Saccharophagus sp. K07]MBC6905073.1 flagellar hook protein FliD [Saccharophagus sp. K07]
MAIDSDYVKQMSSQLAQYEVQASIAKAERNEANYKAQLNAVTSLESALKTFSSAVKGLNSVSSTMLVNKATMSQEGYATANVGTKAIPGNYDFFVQQLASRHQLAVTGLAEDDIGTNTGSLIIGQGAESFTIDLSTVDKDNDGKNSLAELAAAINSAADNTGVKATLVRSNGQVSLVLASEETGLANAITLATSGTGNATFDTQIGAATELSAAKDAEVRLGGENGMLLTNSSNTFNNIIEGVTLTFNKAHAPGEAALNIDIGQDQAATKTKAQTFVNAFNALMSSFDSLTGSGSETTARGPLAGDATIRSIESMLNQAIRKSFGGMTLMEFGIVSDRNGQLTIDTARFNKAIENNPEGFEKLFTEKGNLLDSVDKNLAVYTSSTGLMKTRKESLNKMLRQVDVQFDAIQKQYDNYYNRYLKQYTNMMQIMASMEQTFGMF